MWGVHWYRATDGVFEYSSPDIEFSPDDITDSDWSCYGLGQYGDGAGDGRYYLYVHGDWAPSDDYEFFIKYEPEQYFAPPAPSL